MIPPEFINHFTMGHALVRILKRSANQMSLSFSCITLVLRKVRRSPLISLFGLLFALGQVSFVCGQTTAFTYQGRLTDGGAAANGIYEMQFKLFDGAGNQVGSTITNSAVTLSDSVFTVTLDYGAAAFSGADRFLEIGVRPAGSGNSFTILAPRQQLTSAVYAIRAGSTTTADNATQLGGLAANQYVQTVDSRLSDARPPAPGSSSYIQNTSSVQAGDFNISGNGVASGFLSASTINATSQFSILGTRVLSTAGSFNTFAGASTGVVNTGIGNSFFGNEAGFANTSGALNTFVGKAAGRANQGGGNNSFFGTQAGFANTTGSSNTFIGEDSGNNNVDGFSNTFVGQNSGTGNISGGYNTSLGYSSAEVFPGNQTTLIGAFANTSVAGLTNATAIGYNSKVSQSNSLILGSINTGNGTADTNVGIGTTAPAFRFTVKTPTSSYGMVHTDGTIVVGSYVGGGGGWFGTKSNHSLSFFTNDGGAAMTIETGGTVKIYTLGAAGSTSLCRNASNQISTCSSSLRYKKDLQPFTRGLAVLNQLKPITFKWKADNSDDLGFGAEDIAAVEPLLVTRNDKGEVEGVKYDRISAVLVNAVKEQQAEIEAQRQQIAHQQSELTLQRKQIEELKDLVIRNRRHVSTRRAN
jgi:hypothetical protein